MKVYADDSSGVFLLLPENDWEGLDNLDIFATAGIGGKLVYAGRMGEKGSRFFSITLTAGAHKLVVKGSTADDKWNIAKIRSLFFHNTLSQMTLHGFTLTDYGIGLALAATYCENCGRPMNDRIGWKICRNCAEEICPHPSYEKRIISDDVGIFLCRICLKCGLPDPVDMLRASSLPQGERMAEIQRSSPGITFISSMNPAALPLAVAAALNPGN